MPLIPISTLASVSAIGPNDIIVLEQNGTTYKGTVAQLVANATGGTGATGGATFTALASAFTPAPYGQTAVMTFNTPATASGYVIGEIIQVPYTDGSPPYVGQITAITGNSMTVFTPLQASSASSYASLIDTPPSTPSAYDDEFNGTTLNSSWTTINGGAKTDRTQTVKNGFVVLDGPTPGSSNELYGIYKTCPTGPFTLTQKIGLEDSTAQYIGPSLFIRGTSGIFSFFIMGRGNQSPQLWFSGLSTTGVYGSEVGGGFFAANPCYMRIQYDGTNLKIFASSTGNFSASPVYTEAVSAHVGTPTGFGIGFISENQPTTVSCDWFRITTP